MKLHRLTYLGGLTAVIVATAFLARTGEVEMSNNALAEDANQKVDVSCTATSAAAFVPDLGYAITMPGAVAGVFSKANIGVTASIAGAVSGDGVPVVTKDTQGVGGMLVMYQAAAITKIGGLQCMPNLGYAKLETTGTDSAGDKLDVALEGSTSVDWMEANRVDAAGQKVIFGGGNGVGLISGANVKDGNDADSAQNGEVAFGTLGSDARHRMFLKVKYAGNDSNSFSELIRYTFTPQANP